MESSFTNKCKSINSLQTHRYHIVIRLIIDNFYKEILIITETNIPSHENLTYFGNNNEAHCIYNFSLAPLLIHAIVSGNSFYLKNGLEECPQLKRKLLFKLFVNA